MTNNTAKILFQLDLSYFADATRPYYNATKALKLTAHSMGITLPERRIFIKSLLSISFKHFTMIAYEFYSKQI